MGYLVFQISDNARDHSIAFCRLFDDLERQLCFSRLEH